MSESKKEEKLEPFRICREDSPGGQSLPLGVLFETVFGLLQNDRKKLKQRPPAAPGRPVTKRCEKWGLSLESVHQRSKVRVSYKPSGAGMISGAFFSTYSHTSVQWELQVRLTRRSLS